LIAAGEETRYKCRYQVVRQDGRLWHRELLLDGQPDEATLAEYPLKYVIGSDRHARTYAAEVDGFLVESPLTWYASRQRWDLSPGYDRPGHVSDVDLAPFYRQRGDLQRASWHQRRAGRTTP
jgi:hypothetical protein